MEVPWEFVELLESHAEISIQDRIARKKFTLVFKSTQPRRPLWLPLTLEPGQRVVGCTGGLVTLDSGEVWLGLPSDRGEISFETAERLRLEGGRFRVETFNAFRHQESAVLHRRTVVARIECSTGLESAWSPTHPVTVERQDGCSATLRLDVAGSASLGRFRFFVEPANFVPVGPTEEWEVEESTITSGFLPGSGSDGLSTLDREFVEPRRFRLRRRASLRRLP
jgi:hypothetical protein